MDVPAMLVYLTVTGITPGPNNLMSLYLGAHYGLRASRRFLYGSTFGFGVKALLCGALNVAVAAIVPAAVDYLKWLGAAYMLYLAWTMLRSGFAAQSEEERQGGAATFAVGILLQVVNVKSWISCLSVYSVYVIAHTTAPRAIVLTACAATAVIAASALCWMCFGSAFRRVYSAHRRAFSVVLAASLAVCAVTALQ